MNKAKRKIHAFSFKDDGSHIALVDAAANMQTVLTMKAAEKEVTVTTSMRKFLTKFFNMWSDDAAVLAGVLGYSDGSSADYVDTYIKEQIDSVQLLKGVDQIPDKLPESIALKVTELSKKFGDRITSENTSSEANNSKGDSNLSEVKIDAKELEVLKSAAAKVADLEKAASEIEVLKAQLAETASLKQLVETLKSEKAAKEKKEAIDVVKGYSFVPEELHEKLADFIIKSEGSDLVLETLEKARDAIAAAAGIGAEAGTEAAGEPKETEIEKSQSKVTSKVSEILAKRKS